MLAFLITAEVRSIFMMSLDLRAEPGDEEPDRPERHEDHDERGSDPGPEQPRVEGGGVGLVAPRPANIRSELQPCTHGTRDLRLRDEAKDEVEDGADAEHDAEDQPEPLHLRTLRLYADLLDV